MSIRNRNISLKNAVFVKSITLADVRQGPGYVQAPCHIESQVKGLEKTKKTAKKQK